MSDFNKKLNLNVSDIDELIQELKAIEELALSSDGLGQVNAVIHLLENNLDGLFKKAMVEQVNIRKGIFIKVIEELRDRRIRLEKYREFLEIGALVKVRRNQNYININPLEDMKTASDLELAVSTLLPKILDDYDAIGDANRRKDELETIIASKLRQDPPGEVEEEKRLLKNLNEDISIFNSFDNELPSNLRLTKEEPEHFDETNRLFKTDLDNYDTVWDEKTDYKLDEMSLGIVPKIVIGTIKEEVEVIKASLKMAEIISPEIRLLNVALQEVIKLRKGERQEVEIKDRNKSDKYSLSYWDKDDDGFIDMGIDEEGGVIDGSRYPLGIPDNEMGVPTLINPETGLYYEGDKRIELMKAAGISELDWEYVNYIINNESGWEYTKNNGTGAVGLPQMNLGGSQGEKGKDGKYYAPDEWLNDPLEQMKWANWYANKHENLNEEYKPELIVPNNHYDSWETAYETWKYYEDTKDNPGTWWDSGWW